MSLASQLVQSRGNEAWLLLHRICPSVRECGGRSTIPPWRQRWPGDSCAASRMSVVHPLVHTLGRGLAAYGVQRGPAARVLARSFYTGRVGLDALEGYPY
jgi:hypothetical protein